MALLSVFVGIQFVLVLFLIVMFLVKIPNTDGLSGLGGTNVSNMNKNFANNVKDPSDNFMLALVIGFLANSLIISGIYTSDVKKDSILNELSKPSSKSISLGADGALSDEGGDGQSPEVSLDNVPVG